MEPTGRANARPMTGSAQIRGSRPVARVPDFASLHPGYRLACRRRRSALRIDAGAGHWVRL